MPDKPHFSATQLDMYCRCPEAYRRRYIEKEMIPPGIAAARGKGLHGAAAYNMRQKIDSHQDLPVKDIIDLGMESFDAEVKGGIMLAPDEASRGLNAVVAETQADLLGMLRCHATEQAPDYQPVAVEHLVRIELPNSPRDLLGIIDLATEFSVVDFKTAKRKKTQADADGSIQLTVYAAAFHAEFEEAPHSVSLDTVVSTKTKTERQKLVSQRDAADFRALANRINAVQTAIDAGSYPPAAPGSWNCSARWCGFWNSCAFVNAGRGSQGD